SRTSSGKVYRFQRDPLGVWQDMGRMVPNPPLSARFYGSSMTSWGGSSGQVIIGAEDDITPPSDGYGAAYFFDLSCGACAPDLDLDGTLTIFDFLLFSNLFQDGDPQADFDGDGELTIFDFLAFQTAFDAGC
ncbi:MAG: GC-type dockerin domain-anchored protein, partial [Phycisphaerales bacterium]